MLSPDCANTSLEYRMDVVAQIAILTFKDGPPFPSDLRMLENMWLQTYCEHLIEKNGWFTASQDRVVDESQC